jgi:hypothetical protein
MDYYLNATLTSAYYNSLPGYFAPDIKVFKAFSAFYIKL